MRNIRHALGALAATFGIAGTGLASTAAHAEVFIIANAAMQLSSGEIKDVFTGQKQFAGATRLIPVDNGPAQESFLSSAMHMDAARYNTIWTKKSFREGLNPPTVKSGDTEVIDYVRKTPGAIGYISGTPPYGVTIIHKY